MKRHLESDQDRDSFDRIFFSARSKTLNLLVPFNNHGEVPSDTSNRKHSCKGNSVNTSRSSSLTVSGEPNVCILWLTNPYYAPIVLNLFRFDAGPKPVVEVFKQRDFYSKFCSAILRNFYPSKEERLNVVKEFNVVDQGIFSFVLLKQLSIDLRVSKQKP